MIRFTVVTITYNAEAVLQRTLDSVFAQTYKGVEHLIIDGASKDRTLALVEAYKQKSDESEIKNNSAPIAVMVPAAPPTVIARNQAKQFISPSRIR